MATFGVTGGLAMAEETAAVLVSRTITPRSASVAEVTDEEGDIALRHYYGLGATEEIQETYSIKGRVNEAPKLPKLGYNAFGVVTNISVSTSNSDWVQVAVTYTTGATLDKNKAYALPITCPTGRKASLFLLTGGQYIQSSSFSASCTLSELLDDKGIPCAWAVSGASWEESAEAIDGTFAFTANDSSGLTENGRLSQSNTSYGTVSASASGKIDLEAAA